LTSFYVKAILVRMTLTIRPLTAENFADVETLFTARGCSYAKSCWCLAYRYVKADMPKDKRGGLKRLSKTAKIAPGLIGYARETPVGWISLGPRADFARLATSRVMKPIDDTPVWSVICFVVPKEYRGQGVAQAMLKAGIAFARKHKARVLEAYPYEVDGRTNDQFLWFGTASMYLKAGFVEAARPAPTRPVMRLAL
jgi:GNAT superfamily N-acetyltransferase